MERSGGCSQGDLSRDRGGYLGGPAIPNRMVTPIFIVVFWALSSSISISWRILLRSFLKQVRSRGRNLRQMLIVGTNPRAVRFARSIEGMPELGYRLVGFVDEQWAGMKEFLATGYSFATDLDRFPSFLREHVVDEVALALPMKTCYPKASEIVAQCKEQGIPVRFLPDIFDVASVESKADVPDTILRFRSTRIISKVGRLSQSVSWTSSFP